jgi:hypothetical protein
MKKNTAVVITIRIWDVINGAWKTGDAANITVRGTGDGAGYTPSSPSITEIDATNNPGAYSVSLTAAENNYSVNEIGGKTSTSGCVLLGFQWTNESTATLAAGQIAVKKNTALSGFTFMMTDSTNHAPATGLTVTAQRSLDGAAFASCANSVSEISNGFYKISFAAGDLNGNVVAFRFSATGADDRDFTVITQA